VRSLSDSAANYQTAATMAKTLYESGSSSFLDLLDAQRSVRSAEDNLIQSRMAYAKDHIALAKALGGSWNRPINRDEPAVQDGDTGPHIRRPPA
jgi:outer membrane protein TolC